MNLLNKKPNFFIIGAAKAGTTSLYDLLKQHPQVYLPFEKEPAFFCDEGYYKKGDEWYLNRYFSEVTKQTVWGEATSRYLFYAKKVAPRIKAFLQENQAKFIVILRDPAKLVYSLYWNSVREGYEELPFDEALNLERERKDLIEQNARIGVIRYSYSTAAAYGTQLMDFFKYFPKENFLFLFTDELKDQQLLFAKLQSFLLIDDYSDKIKYVQSNASALPKSRKLHNWLRSESRIKDLIKPFVPYKIRHQIKMSVLEKNLVSYKAPELDEETANSIRKLYMPETIKLQEILQKDLITWLPK